LRPESGVPLAEARGLAILACRFDVERAVPYFPPSFGSMVLSCCLALVSSGIPVLAVANPPHADLKDGAEGLLRYPSSVERIMLEGQLLFPAGTAGRVPVVVLAHGSGGRGPGQDRQDQWAEYLRELGYATFIIDYFGPRGVRWNSDFQPTPLTDAVDALRLLQTHPRIDTQRMAIIGFSRGAQLAYEAANRGKLAADEPRYAAHVALYPSCSALGVGAAGLSAPVLVLIGERDELSPVAQCEALAERAREKGAKFTLKVYPGAYHAWDGRLSENIYHRAIRRSYRIEANAAVTEQSRADVAAFLRSTFAAVEGGR
jgi:dienelactone hydrolase